MRSWIFVLIAGLFVGCASSSATSGTASSGTLPSQGSTLRSTTATFRECAEANDATAYTEVARRRLSEQTGVTEVRVTGPLTLEPQGEGFEGGVLSLDRPWLECRQRPETCNSFSETFLAQMATALRRSSEDGAPTLARLRLAVRDAGTIEAYTRRVAEPFVTFPVVADLVAIVMVDFPESARPLFERELRALGATREQAIARARENVLEELGPMRLREVLSASQERVVVLADGRYYESSQILDPTRFAGLSDSLSGALLVSVPSNDIVLIVADSGPATLAGFATLTRQLAEESSRPLSTAVLRYADGRFAPAE